MADVAVVFHWPLSELAALELEELMHWREQARRRCQPDE